jgi:hypothetical protein
MSQEVPGADIPVQHLEADAVCEQCGTVNPEDTLLCKKCGNNLRDQRLQRVAAGALEAPPRVRISPQALRALLALFAILVVLWVVLNVNNIEEFLVEGFKAAEASDGAVDADYFWDSRDSERYASLLAELDSNPITDEEIQAAMESVPRRGEFEGRYCIQRSSAFRESVIGEALVKKEGDILYFVARIAPDVELRGEAQSKGLSSLETRFAGAKIGEDEFMDIFGSAIWNREGGYTCYGLAGPDDREFAAVAYQIR